MEKNDLNPYLLAYMNMIQLWQMRLCLTNVVLLLGRIARTTNVDAAYCYHPSSVACRSVGPSH